MLTPTLPPSSTTPTLSPHLLSQRLAPWCDALVSKGLAPVCEVLVCQNGKPVFRHSVAKPGLDEPTTLPRIYRAFSMTKPITSVAILMLYEQGLIQLTEPVSKYLGKNWNKKKMRVMNYERTKKEGRMVTEEATRSITIAHLLTHTSGLAHSLSGFKTDVTPNPVDEEYAKAGLSGLSRPSKKIRTIKDFIEVLSQQPLAAHPGTSWIYSFSSDVLGHVVEIVSGKSLGEFFHDNIFIPLQMLDTSFTLAQDKASRLVDLYQYHGKDGLRIANKLDGGAAPGGRYHPSNSWNAGGSGLLTTLDDYSKFCNCILAGGGPILSPATVAWATTNRLFHPVTHKSLSIREMALYGFADDEPKGMGFGYGFAVVDDVGHQFVASSGEASWGGAASTRFWIDKKYNLTVVFMTSVFMPDLTILPLVPALHALVYGALEVGGAVGSRL